MLSLVMSYVTNPCGCCLLSLYLNGCLSVQKTLCHEPLRVYGSVKKSVSV
jgi:hypothetical protein